MGRIVSNVPDAVYFDQMNNREYRYYNATTEVTVTPQMVRQPGNPLCPPLQNYTTTMKWNSILAITERGPYNTGSNSVNIWLTLIPPNYNWSTLPWESSILEDTPFWWALDSSL